MSDQDLLVREARADDANFVAQLASMQPSFTVPTPYVLWMLTVASPSLSLVTTTMDGHRIGYLLAIPCEPPGRAVFLWQIAVASNHSSVRASHVMLEEMLMRCRRMRITRVLFSMRSSPKLIHWARRAALSLVWKAPLKLGAVPVEDAIPESLFELRIPSARKNEKQAVRTHGAARRRSAL